MKRFLAGFLALVLTLTMSVSAFADDWDLSDDDLEALASLIILDALMDEMGSGSSSSRSSSRSSSSSSSKSKSPAVPASSAPVTYVTPYEGYVKTNGSVLNLRRAANKGSTILAQLSNGSRLTVNGYTGEWLSVTANGMSGFVPRRYVQSTGVTTAATTNVTNVAPVASGVQYYAIVNPTNNFVNMRAQPSKNSGVQGIYYYGYQLKVVGEVDNWCQVVDEATGRTGYMMKSLLLRTSEVSYDGEQG